MKNDMKSPVRALARRNLIPAISSTPKNQGRDRSIIPGIRLRAKIERTSARGSTSAPCGIAGLVIFHSVQLDGVDAVKNLIQPLWRAGPPDRAKLIGFAPDIAFAKSWRAGSAKAADEGRQRPEQIIEIATASSL